MSSRTNFHSVCAISRMRTIAAVVNAESSLTTDAIAAKVGLCYTAASDLAWHLVQHKVLCRRREIDGRAHVWRPSPTFAESLDKMVAAAAVRRHVEIAERQRKKSAKRKLRAEPDYVPTRREIRKHWELHMCRDFLVAAMYGTPANATIVGAV